MSRPRVLFVDDEPRILDGLRRSLRGMRGEWEMSFVTSGAAALELIGEVPHDVVVSDMRMPGMNGAELLTHISRLHPEVARVVLSGHTEPESAIKVAVAGHRFLTKPADVEHVIEVIGELTTLAPGHGLRARRIAGAIRTLPTPVWHVDLFTEMLRGPDVELCGAVQAASHNVGLAAKLLQLSGSPFFSSRSRVGSIENVISAVGLPTIQALVNTGQLLWSSPVGGSPAQEYLGQALRHAVATAELVGSMASPGNRAHARAAALLQDVGRFVCLAGAGPDVDLAAPDCNGVPYREVGVELLRLWGLPVPIVTAVARRDTEHRPDATGLGVSAAVRAAHLLIQETESRDPSDGAHDAELATLLAHPQLAAGDGRWREAARDASEQAGRWPPSMIPGNPRRARSDPGPERLGTVVPNGVSGDGRGNGERERS